MPIIEKRYAEAMVEIAYQKGELDIYQQELKDAADLYEGDQDFKLLMTNPEIKIDNKKEIIKMIFGSSFNSETLNFLFLLLEKGRIKNLPGIYKEFYKEADKKRNTLNITIISAKELEQSQIVKIKEKYKKQYNATGVNAFFEIEPDLIGGVKVKIGDKVVDGSIKGRLESLKEALAMSY